MDDEFSIEICSAKRLGGKMSIENAQIMFGTQNVYRDLLRQTFGQRNVYRKRGEKIRAFEIRNKFSSVWVKLIEKAIENNYDFNEIIKGLK